MLSAFFAAALAGLAVSAPSPEAGSVLTYRGTLVAQKGDPIESKKSFDLMWLVTKADAKGGTLAWSLAEQGKGAWGWPDRLGQLEFDDKGQTNSPGPALLYDRADGKSVVGLIAPLIPVEHATLRKDLTWQHDKLDYLVVGQQTMDGKATWKVEGRNAYGTRRVLFVDAQRPVIRSYRERVFIGQGQEFELSAELVEEGQLAEGAQAAAVAGFQKLLELREKLGHTGRTTRIDWNDKQLEILKEAAPRLAGFKDVSILSAVVRAVELDVKSQRGRAGAVASLREKAVGQPIGKWTLPALRGDPLESSALANKVTVLHFWEYRDAPLEEPYGQIGFLDFLHRKRGGAGVQVIGVAVDDQAGDADVKRRVIQSASRLKSFMNLSYPVHVDDGTVLKSLGDPRVAGGKLPLFVVIGKDGKVVEYHAGLFEVQRDRGLEALDQVINKALESRE